MKDAELKLISELMKNSRRSDRDLAKTVGVSQPTVTRLRTKLEKKGIIKEYTMIPDLNAIGFKLAAVTFLKLRKDVTSHELEKIAKMGKETIEKSLKNIMTVRGMGLGYDVMIISIHEDYASYQQLVNDVKQFPSSDLSDMQSFIISLDDKMQYRPLTLSYFSKYLSSLAEKEK